MICQTKLLLMIDNLLAYLLTHQMFEKNKLIHQLPLYVPQKYKTMELSSFQNHENLNPQFSLTC